MIRLKEPEVKQQHRPMAIGIWPTMTCIDE
jgi:hypothetical protein